MLSCFTRMFAYCDSIHLIHSSPQRRHVNVCLFSCQDAVQLVQLILFLFLNLLHIKMYVVFIVFHYINNALSALFETAYGFYILCFCFAFVPLPTTCVWIVYLVWRKEIKTVCVARLGFSTVYVTLCLRYSMYWFPRYNVSFRQHFCVRQGQSQGHAPDQDQGHGHFSNSDEEGGITRRRVPRRTSSEIASAKIAGRPIPVKVRGNQIHLTYFTLH